MRENQLAMDLFDLLSTQLIVGGLGTIVGVSHANLPWLMERYDVPEEEQLDLLEKFRIIEIVFVKNCNKHSGSHKNRV